MHETEEARQLRECEAMLKDFFKQKEKLEAELRALNTNIEIFGRAYWKRLGYTVMPRIERLRAAILGA